MTDYCKAIEATIPPGDPHSNERRDWCKAAIRAYARVMLAHSEGDPDLTMMVIRVGFMNIEKEVRNGTLSPLDGVQ